MVIPRRSGIRQYNRACDLCHCSDGIMTGTHTLGGKHYCIDGDIPALSPDIATAINNKCPSSWANSLMFSFMSWLVFMRDSGFCPQNALSEICRDFAWHYLHHEWEMLYPRICLPSPQSIFQLLIWEDRIKKPPLLHRYLQQPMSFMYQCWYGPPRFVSISNIVADAENP